MPWPPCAAITPLILIPIRTDRISPRKPTECIREAWNHSGRRISFALCGRSVLRNTLELPFIGDYRKLLNRMDTSLKLSPRFSEKGHRTVD